MKVAAYAGCALREELLRERELHLRESEELLRVGRKLAVRSLAQVLMADIEQAIARAPRRRSAS